MRRVWDLGNTTVRNPNRIRDGLLVFSDEFQGNIYGEQQESAFIVRLKEKGVLNTAGGRLAWFGRKWRNVFVKLGFITANFTKDLEQSFKTIQSDLHLSGKLYELTPAGEMLINAKSDGAISDVFTRQLICLEVPSPIETSFKQFKMKPFIFFLEVLFELNGRHEEGLSKIEIAIFLQLFRNHDRAEITKTVKEILDYRNVRSRIKGNVKIKEYDRRFLMRKAKVGKVRYTTLIDYADTTIRYSKLTGLISFNGGTINLRQNKIEFIKALLQKEPKFASNINGTAYLKEFYNGAALPTDDPKFAFAEICRIANQIEDMGKFVPATVRGLSKDNDIRMLESERYNLIDILSQGEEDRFAFNQSSTVAIKEIINSLDLFSSGGKKASNLIIDPPTYLEWIVWRSFLAIDRIYCPINKTRRFPIDEDMLPRHHAPGGGPDMIFEYEDFILVIEATLTTSTRQEAAEGEPVRRHVASVVQDNPGKKVLGLFIAPSIDNNTAETLKKDTWYVKNETVNINIVPITIKHLYDAITKYSLSSFLPEELLEVLNACLKYRNETGPKWKEKINTIMDLWVKNMPIS